MLVGRKVHSQQRRWTAAMVRWKGRLPGPAMAKRLRLSVGAVEKKRFRRGIAPFRPLRAPFVWDADSISLLGTDADAAVGAALGISGPSVARERRLLEIPPAFPRRRGRRIPAWTKR